MPPVVPPSGSLELDVPVDVPGVAVEPSSSPSSTAVDASAAFDDAVVEVPLSPDEPLPHAKSNSTSESGRRGGQRMPESNTTRERWQAGYCGASTVPSATNGSAVS